MDDASARDIDVKKNFTFAAKSPMVRRRVHSEFFKGPIVLVMMRNRFVSRHRRQHMKIVSRGTLWGLLVLVLATPVIVACWPEGRFERAVQSAGETAEFEILAVVDDEAPVSEVFEPPPNIIVHPIQPGDNLSAIFSRFELGNTALYQILGADESLLALDILRPGHTLTFRLDELDGRLMEMELFIHAGKRVVYQRADDETFIYEEIILSGEWQQQVLSGEIYGTFYHSAKEVGLSEGEIAQLNDLLKERLDFAREIRAGDPFQVIRTVQFVDGEATGQSRIEGVRILRGKRVHSAFLCDDGNYYDHNGDSVMRAFLRYPTEKRFRVSSSFNPARRHPVTGRVTPHNGTDFPMPIGTPVLSTGDGVVTRVSNHPFAGKYVEIRHGGDYTTRYLHLNRILVRQGQSVKRGERIALSGNTGRSTGPHLHFELHVRGRPVNPLTADIPLSVSVPKERRTEFLGRVAELTALMDNPHQQIALR